MRCYICCFFFCDDFFVATDAEVFQTKRFIQREKYFRSHFVGLFAGLSVDWRVELLCFASRLVCKADGNTGRVAGNGRRIAGGAGLEYQQQKNAHSSILLARFDGRQWGEQTTDLEYEMIEVKWQAFYDWCLQQYLQENKSFPEAGVYQALKVEFQQPVYQYYVDDKPVNQWLLCKDNRILKLRASWPLTEAQLQIVGEKL